MVAAAVGAGADGVALQRIASRGGRAGRASAGMDAASCGLCPPDSDAWVIGGAQIYTQALPLASRVVDSERGRARQMNAGAAAAGVSAPGKRTVRVEFDGGVNSKLPWAFHPEQLTMDVVPGELNEALYFARNDGKVAIVGSAVPSVAPARASDARRHSTGFAGG